MEGPLFYVLAHIMCVAAASLRGYHGYVDTLPCAVGLLGCWVAASQRPILTAIRRNQTDFFPTAESPDRCGIARPAYPGMPKPHRTATQVAGRRPHPPDPKEQEFVRSGAHIGFDACCFSFLVCRPLGRLCLRFLPWVGGGRLAAELSCTGPFAPCAPPHLPHLVHLWIMTRSVRDCESCPAGGISTDWRDKRYRQRAFEASGRGQSHHRDPQASVSHSPW